jgi:serine/threonine protein kinase
MNPDDQNDPLDKTLPLDTPTELMTQKLTDNADQTLILNDAAVTQTITEERRSVLDIVQSSGIGQNTPGTTLKEKYEVLGELGRGGMGEVLRVRDRDLKRDVAMKRLLANPHAGQSVGTRDDLIRFIEEAQATGQLEHPNIVPVHDIGLDAEGRVYFTLKYVQGLSLKKVIRGRAGVGAESGTFRAEYSALRMIEILISICQAVAYAHSKRIIHRDLKPDNVMLGKYGEVLVMDWGLAKVLGSKRTDRNRREKTVKISTSRAEDASQATMEGSIAGTPAYMSPEQAEGKISELNERTDIYSLGAILYEVLTGEPPYGGGTALEVIRQVVADAPRTLKKRKGVFGFSPIPRELGAICDRAMARRPEDRYATVSDMRADLQAYLENLPVSAAPDNWLQQFGKWVKRNRRQVQSSALTAAAVLLLVFTGWLGWHTWRLHQLINEGRNRLEAARSEFKYKSPPIALSANDPYAGQMGRALWAQKAGPYRNRIQQAMEPLRKAIDLSPNDPDARTLLAEANMELWRLAVFEQNEELAKVTRRDVESFSPDPALYSAELNGFGSFIATFDAPDADAFLFSFETLNVPVKGGAPEPPRLIPVPYDLKEHRPDAAFLEQEAQRIAAAKPVPVDRHSIFNLEPTPASKAGTGGQLVIPQLEPGNYMLLVRAPGRVDVRISFRLDRLTRLKEQYVLPKTEENPPGFFYMAGGDVIVGGDTAGAPAPHTMKIAPAWIYHDEISMGEYGAFLQFLFKSGKAAEAKQRLPKDFGRNIATLGSGGELIPAETGVDAAAFGKSPVRGVSFSDAQAYVAWRGNQEGLPYRLPQDWEWESACRGAGRTQVQLGRHAGQRPRGRYARVWRYGKSYELALGRLQRRVPLGYP